MSHKLKLLLLFFTILVISCAKDDQNDVKNRSLLSFIGTSVPKQALSAEGGTFVLQMKWSYTQWTLRAGDAVSGEKFINAITPSTGGDASTAETNSTVTVLFSPNLKQSANKQKLILSSPSGELIDTITITQSARVIPSINLTIDPAVTYQTISGFGGANAIWGTDYLTESEMNLAFGKGENGLGLSIYRVRLSSSKNDWAGLVNSIKMANQRNAVVLASPWSPPADWKSNNSSNGGGYLLKDRYADFANYINEFIQYMQDRGAKVDVVSIQNEPDWKAGYEGCEYTTTEMYNFVKNYAGLIKGARVLAAESLNTNHAYTDQILNDPVAVNNLHIVGGHLYGSGLKPYPLAEQKGKEVWMTEHLLNLDSGNKPENWTANTPVAAIWKESMEMVKEVQLCMNYNWNAYIWWYIRRYYSFLGDGERGTTRGQILKRGYAFSQFSNYIRPGYVRVKAQFENASVMSATAYSGENKLTIVIVNPSEMAVQGVSVKLPSAYQNATAYTTSELLNRQQQILPVSNSTINIIMNPSSITTIVLQN